MPRTSERPIKITFFPGMSNVEGVQEISERDNILFPSIILNMNVTPQKKLDERIGQTEFVELDDVHSLFSDGIQLFAGAKGSASPESIWKISVNGIKTEIQAVNGKLHPLFYVPVNNLIYISSKVWNGVYQYSTGTIRAWGQIYNDDPSSIDSMYSSEEMITLGVIPAPFMENLCLHGSRIWGSVDKRAYYNDPPLAFEMYQKDSFLEFDDELTMIARTARGMYFSTSSSTWFTTGLQPQAMVFNHVGNGALPGSLQYGLFQKLSKEIIPVWTSPTGIVAGMENGSIISLTTGRVRFDAIGRAASFFRIKDAIPQYLSNFPLPSVATFGDSATCEVMRNGKLI